MKENQYRVKPAPCPFCKKINDAASCIADNSRKPVPGDIAICIKCGELSEYTADLQLKTILPAEVIKRVGLVEYLKLLKGQAWIREQNKKKNDNQ